MSIYDDYGDFNGSVIGPDDVESTIGPKIAHIIVTIGVVIIFMIIGACTIGLFIGR